VRFGQGRPAKQLEIGTIREVGVEEIRSTKSGSVPAVQKIRDHHHQIAKMAALGMSSAQIATVMNLTLARVSILVNDAAMRELIEHYRRIQDPEALTGADFGTLGLMTSAHARAVRIASARLEDVEAGEREMADGALFKVLGDLSDRVGFGKHSTVTVDTSFAAKLERARQRSGVKQIEGKAERVTNLPQPVTRVEEESPGESSVPPSSVEPEVEPDAVLPPAQGIERRRA
jgi:hypothetical protein